MHIGMYADNYGLGIVYRLENQYSKVGKHKHSVC